MRTGRGRSRSRRRGSCWRRRGASGMGPRASRLARSSSVTRPPGSSHRTYGQAQCAPATAPPPHAASAGRSPHARLIPRSSCASPAGCAAAPCRRKQGSTSPSRPAHARRGVAMCCWTVSLPRWTPVHGRGEFAMGLNLAAATVPFGIWCDVELGASWEISALHCLPCEIIVRCEVPGKVVKSSSKCSDPG